MHGINVRRPSMVRWDSSSQAKPFIIESHVMPNTLLRVWRTDGYTGAMPRSDWRTLTETAWAAGKVHHICNHHGSGYTRYDVQVVEATARNRV